MEGLYLKLYEKYSTIKTKNFSELAELNNDQDDKFVSYVAAAEEVINCLNNEKAELMTKVNDLRNEVASIRSTSDDLCVMYQKLFMEEKEKNKSLSEEVDRLQKLYLPGPSCSSNDGKNNNSQLDTPQCFAITPSKNITESRGRMTRKRTRQAMIEAESGVVAPVDNSQDVIVRESVKEQPNRTSASRGISQLPECCRSTIDISGGGGINRDSTKCIFHDLIEYLVGMKLSVNQTDGICVSVLHQSSGFSFSLTWVNEEPGKEPELLYRVTSLGTFERVAPEWMREVLTFSPRMCPMFFERIAKLHR